MHGLLSNVFGCVEGWGTRPTYSPSTVTLLRLILVKTQMSPVLTDSMAITLQIKICVAAERCLLCWQTLWPKPLEYKFVLQQKIELVRDNLFLVWQALWHFWKGWFRAHFYQFPNLTTTRGVLSTPPAPISWQLPTFKSQWARTGSHGVYGGRASWRMVLVCVQWFLDQATIRFWPVRGQVCSMANLLTTLMNKKMSTTTHTSMGPGLFFFLYTSDKCRQLHSLFQKPCILHKYSIRWVTL